MNLVDHDSSTFTTAELQRLAAYRAAVAAGFYTDWDGSTTSTDVETFTRLLRATSDTGETSEWPFSPSELERLEHYRAAVAAGYYGEDR
ncbi:MAG TPA: hypothetical protein VFG86_17955 [Chloroflexota bacterium]|nr:hypothetical protein [Chloroflexota bacterium]